MSKFSRFPLKTFLIVIVLLISASFTLWYFWAHAEKEEVANNKTVNNLGQKEQPKSAAGEVQKTYDPSEGGKYLVIKEWGVRFPLSEEIIGQVGYSLGEKSTDLDGNVLQSAKILVTVLGYSSVCAESYDLPGYLEIGAQIIRTEADKHLDSDRYRWTFQENVLEKDGFLYHINFVTPFCADGELERDINTLQGDLSRLESV